MKLLTEQQILESIEIDWFKNNPKLENLFKMFAKDPLYFIQNYLPRKKSLSKQEQEDIVSVFRSNRNATPAQVQTAIMKTVKEGRIKSFGAILIESELNENPKNG